MEKVLEKKIEELVDNILSSPVQKAAMESYLEESAMQTPSQRIFPELYGIVKYQKRNKEVSAMPSEEEVVETVEKYRKGILDKEITVPSESGTIKKDNVSPDTVVDMINQQRQEE